MSTRSSRSLFEVALILTSLLIGGAVGLEIGVRPRIEPVPLGERYGALADFPATWILTMGLWMLIALALLGFFVVVLWEFGSRPATRWAAWLVGAATLVALAARIALAGALPLVATLEGTRAFATVELFLWRLELIGVRPLVLAGVIVLSRGLLRSGEWGRGLGAVVVLLSLAVTGVVAAGGAGHPSWALYGVPFEACLLGAWSLVVARGLERQAAG